MAQQIQVFGAAVVQVGTGASGTLETLCSGGTRNGVQLTFDGYYGDVFADSHGGDEGPPIDVQYFGETVRIELMLTKWEGLVADKMAVRTRGGTLGVPATPGVLMFQDSLSYRMLITSVSGTALNFPQCVFREPIQINKGTKHSTMIISGTAYKNAAGVLMNSETGS